MKRPSEAFRKFALPIAAVAAISACDYSGDGAEQPRPVGQCPAVDDIGGVCSPSFLRVIVNPERFDGLDLGVFGFIKKIDGRRMLFRSREDASIRPFREAIFLYVDGSKLHNESFLPIDDTCVIVVGNYKASSVSAVTDVTGQIDVTSLTARPCAR